MWLGHGRRLGRGHKLHACGRARRLFGAAARRGRGGWLGGGRAAQQEQQPVHVGAAQRLEQRVGAAGQRHVVGQRQQLLGVRKHPGREAIAARLRVDDIQPARGRVVAGHYVGQFGQRAHLQRRRKAPANKLPLHLQIGAEREPAGWRGPARAERRAQRQVGWRAVAAGLAVAIDFFIHHYPAPGQLAPTHHAARLTRVADGDGAAPQRVGAPAIGFQPQCDRAQVVVARDHPQPANARRQRGVGKSPALIRLWFDAAQHLGLLVARQQRAARGRTHAPFDVGVASRVGGLPGNLGVRQIDQLLLRY